MGRAANTQKQCTLICSRYTVVSKVAICFDIQQMVEVGRFLSRLATSTVLVISGTFLVLSWHHRRVAIHVHAPGCIGRMRRPTGTGLAPPRMMNNCSTAAAPTDRSKEVRWRGRTLPLALWALNRESCTSQPWACNFALLQMKMKCTCSLLQRSLWLCVCGYNLVSDSGFVLRRVTWTGAKMSSGNGLDVFVVSMALTKRSSGHVRSESFWRPIDSKCGILTRL